MNTPHVFNQFPALSGGATESAITIDVYERRAIRITLPLGPWTAPILVGDDDLPPPPAFICHAASQSHAIH